ncbi:MAG: hypothetical protein M5U28_24750 [Sandaracinaceae bacterium]|nr:hypothetical protein [Sandaracinaceae bacterium]
MHALARGLALGALLLFAPRPALAQEPDEARAAALRERGRAELREGRIEDAFAAFGDAVALTRDPTVWLELGDAADRLRVDDVALAAYERYLAARPDAPDRAEVEGRVRVLREIARGRRFSPGSAHPLVDWDGRPLSAPRASRLVSLARWDGTVGGARGARAPELLPFPAPARGLGRRLSPP